MLKAFYFGRTCPHHGTAVFKAFREENLLLADVYWAQKAKLRSLGLGCCKLHMIEKPEYQAVRDAYGQQLKQSVKNSDA